MTLDLTQFQMGVEDLLDEKRAGIIGTNTSENILPYLSGQKKWKYVLTSEGLKLSDGDRVYGFGLPNPSIAEMTEVPKLDDVTIRDFEHGKLSGGTAQVHRASPDSIYLTLSDGRLNPTFSLEHSKDKTWKYLPSKKLISRKVEKAPSNEIKAVSPEALLAGAEEAMQKAAVIKKEDGVYKLYTKDLKKVLGTHSSRLKAIKQEYAIQKSQEKIANAMSLNWDANQANNALQGGLNFGKQLLNTAADHPILATLGGLYAAKKISNIRKATSSAYQNLAATKPKKLLNREFTLPLLAGLAGSGLANTFK